MIPPNACPICGKRRQMTKEDVVPSWLRQEFIRRDPRYGGTRRVVLRICAVCNRAFGKFEQGARDLLIAMTGGQPVRLSPQSQVIVARWITKIVLMHALREARNPVHEPHARYDLMQQDAAWLRHMKASGTPPAQTVVRVGILNIEDKTTMPNRNDLPHFPPQTPRLEFIGHSGFERLYCEVLIGDPAVLLHVEQARPKNDDWFIRIWPSQLEDVEWPPFKVFNWRTAELLPRLWRIRGGVHSALKSFHI